MGRGGASLSKPPQQGERELMGKQVLVFLSQPGEAAEKDAGGGVGGGWGQSKAKGRTDVSAGMWSQSHVRFGLQNTPQDVGCRLYRSQDVREECPPLLKKSSPFDCSL